MTSTAKPWSRQWFEDVAMSVVPNAAAVDVSQSQGIVHVVVFVGRRSWWSRKRIEKVIRDRILKSGDRPPGVGACIEVRRAPQYR